MKTFSTLGLALLASASCLAQPPAPEQHAARPEPAHTSLWKVSNGSTTLYLGGAMYAMRPADYPLPRAFEDAYAEAASLYLEIDLDNPAETGAELTPEQRSLRMHDPEGKLLHEVLQPDNYQRLIRHMESYGIPIAAISPWSAQMVREIFLADKAHREMGATAGGVTAYFASKAQADGKPIVGLETADTQRTIAQSVNEGLENALIETTLTDMESGKFAKDVLTQLEAWRQGDVATINLVPEALRTENADDYALVYTNRIDAWLPKIAALLDSAETELVLVGPTYLVGPQGLVSLLRSRGYTITQL